MNTIGQLTAVPKNTIAKLGDRVELECGTDASIPVSWHFSLAGSQNSMFIYYSGVITFNISDKYVIDNIETGRYNLIMNSVDLSMGGTYTCSDAPRSQGSQQSTGLPGTAELIVIGRPTCTSVH